MLHQLCKGRKDHAEALKIILENCENHILDINLETKVDSFFTSIFYPHFNIQDFQDKHTAFTLACKRTVPELIQCLLEYGKDVDCNYHDPWKVLSLALFFLFLELITFFLFVE